MSRIVEPRYDSTGKLIQEHDVLRDEETGEIALVSQAKNRAGVRGLAVENKIIGLGIGWMFIRMVSGLSLVTLGYRQSDAPHKSI